MLVVGKHIEDIVLNPLEFLLDSENGDYKTFESKEEIINFFTELGWTPEQMEYLAVIDVEKVDTYTLDDIDWLELPQQEEEQNFTYD